jgi:hypothetical protein
MVEHQLAHDSGEQRLHKNVVDGDDRRRQATTASGAIYEAFMLLDILVQGTSLSPSGQSIRGPNTRDQHDWEGNWGRERRRRAGDGRKRTEGGEGIRCNTQSAMVGACCKFGGQTFSWIENVGER